MPDLEGSWHPRTHRTRFGDVWLASCERKNLLLIAHILQRSAEQRPMTWPRCRRNVVSLPLFLITVSPVWAWPFSFGQGTNKTPDLDGNRQW